MYTYIYIHTYIYARANLPHSACMYICICTGSSARTGARPQPLSCCVNTRSDPDGRR